MKKNRMGFVSLMFALSLVACGGTNAGNPAGVTCKHANTEFKFNEATSKHYEVCKDCGEKVNDKESACSKKADPSKTDVASTCQKKGKKFYKCDKCGHAWEEEQALGNHTMVDDATKQGKAATCTEDGTKFQKCSVCGGEEKEVADPTKKATGHNNSTPEVIAKTSTRSETSYFKCSTCGDVTVRVSSLSYTAVEGTAKAYTGEPDAMKLSANGNYVTYVFDMSADVANVQVALYGRISSGNDNYGIINGGEANIEVKVNDTVVEITNDKTCGDMGIPSDGVSAAQAFLGGTTSLKAGLNTITYKRTGSYNMHLVGLDFVYQGNAKPRNIN